MNKHCLTYVITVSRRSNKSIILHMLEECVYIYSTIFVHRREST